MFVSSNAPGHRARSLIVRQTDDAVVAFRIVKGVNRGDPATLDSLRSNYELGARPRGLEIESALIHLGLSMYLTLKMATATARRWPRIGRRVAEIHLQPENGFCYADTAQPGHITVWGRPLQLLSCVVDILTVGD
jgi:hypothetical protein